MTFFFKDWVTTFFPPTLEPGSDDHTFRELLVLVWNLVLLRLQDLKVTEKEAEEIGFMLRRVWLVGQAYAEKKKQHTLQEWMGKLKSLAKEFGVQLC